MSDREAILAMLKRAGIEPKESSARTISIVRGYAGFVTIFSFDDSGALIDIRAEE